MTCLLLKSTSGFTCTFDSLRDYVLWYRMSSQFGAFCSDCRVWFDREVLDCCVSIIRLFSLSVIPLLLCHLRPLRLVYYTLHSYKFYLCSASAIHGQRHRFPRKKRRSFLVSYKLMHRRPTFVCLFVCSCTVHFFDPDVVERGVPRHATVTHARAQAQTRRRHDVENSWLPPSSPAASTTIFSHTEHNYLTIAALHDQ